ncbi:Tom37 C-terminal domain-containing protein [Xylariales sp. PMI_506]|nr:Tom37 C-terminal domain-containing protein [Xylariales sp. PMI_506]
MALELHVWGPAFGLPSIDPECLAAASYLGYTVPPTSWTLIASNDPYISPDHILPALYHEGTWTSGYLNIVSYLGEELLHGVDDSLTPTQRADLLAYTAFLESRGSALVSFSLYVSPSAWSEVTRPAYSSLLPFPLTWTVPLRLRNAAIARTEHLGLDQFAADVDPEDGTSESNIMAPTTSTGFLRLPIKPSVSSSMAPEQAAAIRLQRLTDDLLSVLDEVRCGDRFYFGREQPCSLDFLVFAYLQFLLVRTPHPFMEKCIKRSTEGARLLQFLDIMQRGPVVWKQGKPSENLPWAASGSRSLLGTLGQFTGDALEHVPGFAEPWKKWQGKRVQAESHERDMSQVLFALGGAVAGLTALGGAALFRSSPPWGAPVHRFEPTKSGLHQFGGDIGAMFESLPTFTDASPSSQA